MCRSPEENHELKKYTQQYVKTIKRLFHADNLLDNISSKAKNFDYEGVLKEKTASHKGQLRRQLEQIVNNLSIFEKTLPDMLKD